MHFGIRRLKEDIIVRKEPRVAIIPTAKLAITRLYVAEIRHSQLQRYIVIVEIPQCVTINREHSVFTDDPLHV